MEEYSYKFFWEEIMTEKKNTRVSLSMAVTLSIGAIIGSGIFVYTGFGVQYCGAAIPLAFVLAAILTCFMTLPSMQLGSAIPATGGTYMYVSRFTHPFFGFIQILNSLIGTLNIGILTGTFGVYFAAAFLSNSVIGGRIAGVVMLVILAVIATKGIRLSGRLQQVIVLILCGSLIIYTLSGFNDLNSEYFTFAKMMKPLGGISGLWAAIAVVRYTLQGGTIALAYAEEMENPGRDVPLSFFIGVGVTAVIYAVVGWIFVATAPYDVIAGKSLSVSAEMIMSGVWLKIFLVGGGMLATMTTLNGSLIMYPRIHWAAARDGIWPEIFAKKNKNNVPAIILWLVTAVGVAVTMSGVSVIALFKWVSVPALLIGPIYMIPGAILPFKLPNCHKKAYFRMNKWVTLVISIISAGISFTLGLSIFKRMTTASWIGMICFFTAGTIYWFIRTNYLKKKKDIDLVKKMRGYHPLWLEIENGKSAE